jgi:hypothetical protein
MARDVAVNPADKRCRDAANEKSALKACERRPHETESLGDVVPFRALVSVGVPDRLLPHGSVEL